MATPADKGAPIGLHRGADSGNELAPPDKCSNSTADVDTCCLRDAWCLNDPSETYHGRWGACYCGRL